MKEESTPHVGATRDSERRALLAGIGGLAAGAFLTAGRAEAGSLNPPGAPAPTAKPLGEVEPRVAINSTNTPGDGTNLFIISEPGSYYLPRSIRGRAGMNGILIAADNVAIDMMGFALEGVTDSLTGIAVDAPHDNLIIRNGIVRDWGADGIDMFGGGQRGTVALLENIHSTGNALLGIRGNHSSVAISCVVRGNGNVGLSLGDSSVMENCHALGNGSSGLSAGTGSTIRACTARANTGTGISVSSGSTVVDCTARLNTGVGINAQSSTVAHCSSFSNSKGIDVSGGGVALHCVSILNQGHGIEGSDISHCHAQQNTGAGFLVSFSGTVTQCTTRSNGTHGISANNFCIVRDCNSRSNGSSGTGAGIHLAGVDSRIEDNNCSDNRIGIHVTGSGNFVARNTCSGNATNNWDIAASNKCLVINGANADAFTGNAGGVSPGSSDPNANYTF